VDTNVSDALNKVRSSTQDLHRAISDTVAKRGGATKADLQAFAHKAKEVTESTKASMEAAKASLGAQNEVTKKHLADAVAQLEATQKHVSEGLKTSGQEFQNSVKQALVDTRASVQKVSEAVAAVRSTTSTRPPR
jgi:fructose-specific phosphotransferase system component IIB